ncbi:DUF4435 domain-containing protein [Bacillus toyonensis]|uniref:DUF4435 domain-containing protein n=1 Tax=Bacillus toyonensis TaxID=155322 RepID=UPI0009A80206|nr:DUF4435 domain-containing protein [Bacillus toyonensis]SLK12258.1 Protein of unknown function [Bacillus toyonensis]
MGIKRGSAITEHAKAVLTESRFTKKALQEEKLLLLEGPDDIEVIRNFYLYKNGGTKGKFRLIKANETEFDETNTVAGKRNALNLFEKLKQEKRNVICLLDRDYDFYLKETYQDPKVKYYNYYELENYLFEDSLLRVVLKHVYDYPDFQCYEQILLSLHDIEKACKPYVLMCFLREVNYRKGVLTEEQITKVLKIIKVTPHSMMEMRHLGIDNALQRISSYIETELEKVNLSIERVKEIIHQNDFELGSLIDISKPLDLFRYAIKGKVVVSCFTFFLKYILENNSHLEEFKSQGDLSSLTRRLKIEWIPNLSRDFTDLLNEIEVEFEKEKIG